MKNKFLSPLIAGIALTCFALTVQADPIDGGISFSGNVTVNTGDIDTADWFTAFNSSSVTSLNGSYVGVAGLNISSLAAMNLPFSWDPASGPLAPLWQTAGFVANGDRAAITSYNQPGDGTLTIHGTGMLHLTGFDPTMGTWILSVTEVSSTLGYSFSAGSNLPRGPDGGTTSLLLGLGLLGVGVVARRFKRA
jgi:hypothetical protein